MKVRRAMEAEFWADWCMDDTCLQTIHDTYQHSGLSRDHDWFRAYSVFLLIFFSFNLQLPVDIFFFLSRGYMHRFPRLRFWWAPFGWQTKKTSSTFLAQLRSGYCARLNAYKHWLNPAVQNSSPDCNATPGSVVHLFECPMHQTYLTPVDLWLQAKLIRSSSSSSSLRRSPLKSFF